MNVITLYKCSFCGEKFDNADICGNHESRHSSDLEIIDRNYYQKSQSKETPLSVPDELVIKVTDSFQDKYLVTYMVKGFKYTK